MLQIENLLQMDEALDGQSKWIYSIIKAYTGKYQGFTEDQEDFLGDFIVCYLQNRHKYDPARASRSHWTYWLFRSWAWRRRQKQQKLPKFTQREADAVKIGVQLEADEIELVECFVNNPRTESIKGLVKHSGVSQREVEDRLHAIRRKVANRRRQVIVRN